MTDRQNCSSYRQYPRLTRINPSGATALLRLQKWQTTIFMATVAMDYSPSKQTTKQWHYCQQETEEPVSSQQAPKLTCSNNRANRGYHPNHDVAPCRIGSLTTADTVNSGWEIEPAAEHRRETHVSLKENRNRIPKRKIISCLTCKSLFHFSRAMFSLDNEPVNVWVFLFANNLYSRETPRHQACHV